MRPWHSRADQSNRCIIFWRLSNRTLGYLSCIRESTQGAISFKIQEVFSIGPHTPNVGAISYISNQAASKNQFSFILTGRGNHFRCRWDRQGKTGLSQEICLLQSDSHLTILSDNTEVLLVNEAVVKLHDSWMVKISQQIRLVHCINCLVWLQISHWYFFQNFPAIIVEDFRRNWLWLVNHNELSTFHRKVLTAVPLGPCISGLSQAKQFQNSHCPISFPLCTYLPALFLSHALSHLLNEESFSAVALLLCTKQRKLENKDNKNMWTHSAWIVNVEHNLVQRNEKLHKFVQSVDTRDVHSWQSQMGFVLVRAHQTNVSNLPLPTPKSCQGCFSDDITQNANLEEVIERKRAGSSVLHFCFLVDYIIHFTESPISRIQTQCFQKYISSAMFQIDWHNRTVRETDFCSGASSTFFPVLQSSQVSQCKSQQKQAF